MCKTDAGGSGGVALELSSVLCVDLAGWGVEGGREVQRGRAYVYRN